MNLRGIEIEPIAFVADASIVMMVQLLLLSEERNYGAFSRQVSSRDNQARAVRSQSDVPRLFWTRIMGPFVRPKHGADDEYNIDEVRVALVVWQGAPSAAGSSTNAQSAGINDKRWNANRTKDIVMRLLRGECVEQYNRRWRLEILGFRTLQEAGRAHALKQTA